MNRPAALLAIASLTLGLRLLRLGHAPLTMEEAFLWDVVRGPAARAFEVYATEPNPPGFTALLWLWTRVGDDRVWLRLPSALATAATAALAARIAWRAAGPNAGAVAGLFVAASPLFQALGQLARPYAFVAFALTLALDGVLGWRRDGRRGDLARAVVGAVAAGASHYLAAPFLAVLLVGLRDRRDGRVAAAIIVAALLPVLGLAAIHVGADRWSWLALAGTPHDLLGVLRVVVVALQGTSSLTPFGDGLGFAALLFVGLAVVAIRRDPDGPALAAYTIAPLLLAWALAQRFPLLVPRYYGAFAAAALTLSAIGAARVWDRGGRLVAAVALVVTGSATAFELALADRDNGAPTVADWLRDRPRDEPVLFVSEWGELSVRYEAGDLGRKVTGVPERITTASRDEAAAAIAAIDGERLWVVLSDAWYADPEGLLAPMLEAWGDRVETRRAGMYEVAIYRR